MLPNTVDSELTGISQQITFGLLFSFQSAVKHRSKYLDTDTVFIILSVQHHSGFEWKTNYLKDFKE